MLRSAAELRVQALLGRAVRGLEFEVWRWLAARVGVAELFEPRPDSDVGVSSPVNVAADGCQGADGLAELVGFFPMPRLEGEVDGGSPWLVRTLTSSTADAHDTMNSASSSPSAFTSCG